MAELNFGLLNPPGSQSIGNAFVTGMDQAAAARAQENQNAMAQYTLSKAKREDEMQNQLYSAVRQPGFKLDIGTAMQFGAPGLAAYKAQQEAGKTQAETDYKRAQTGAIPGQMARDKAATAASNAAQREAKQKFANQATRDLAANPSDDNIRAYGQDAVLSGLFTEEEAAKITAMQLAIPMEQRAAQFRQAGAAAATPKAKSDFETLLTDSGLSAEQQNVIRKAKLDKDTAIAQPEFIDLANKLKTTTDPVERNRLTARMNFLTTHAPGTNVSVDARTGNKFGEAFGAGVAGTDVALRAAAVDAPALAANANETLKLLDNPKIFTGGMANIKLELARALNVVGATDTERIANTEQLIRGTGKATLAAIKTSGLGTGQGFTDKDLKMLQGVEGGTIELTPAALREFARAQHNAANAIVKKWDSRRGTMPADVLKATGIDKETYTIPPLRREYVGFKDAPDGRRLGITADGTVEVVN